MRIPYPGTTLSDETPTFLTLQKQTEVSGGRIVSTAVQDAKSHIKYIPEFSLLPFCVHVEVFDYDKQQV